MFVSITGGMLDGMLGQIKNIIKCNCTGGNLAQGHDNFLILPGRDQ
jgi:hypothetical protein